MKSKDNLGRFTKGVSILLTKELQKRAEEIEMKIKPEVRNKLEAVHINNVRESFAPISTTR